MPELIPTKYILRFLLVFGLGFSLVGVGVVVFAAVPIVRDAQASLGWPSTTGRVVASRVEVASSGRQTRRVDQVHRNLNERTRRNDGRETKYTATVIYDYEVDGKTYQGDRVFLGKWTSTSRSEPREIVQRYPVGDEVTVYYLAEDANNSILEPGVTRGAEIYFLIGGIFAGAGLLVACIPLVAWTWQGWSAKPKGPHDRFA